MMVTMVGLILVGCSSIFKTQHKSTSGETILGKYYRNPIALRKAKIVIVYNFGLSECNFGLSECNRVNCSCISIKEYKWGDNSW